MAIEAMSSSIPVQTQTTIRKPEVSASKSVEAVEVSGNRPEVSKQTVVFSDVQQNGQKMATTEQDQQTQNRRIRKAVEQMNQAMSNTEALFGIHEGTNRVTIKIVDSETKEVIKELPPEKTLDMIEKVWELAGMLVDERR